MQNGAKFPITSLEARSPCIKGFRQPLHKPGYEHWQPAQTIRNPPAKSSTRVLSSAPVTRNALAQHEDVTCAIGTRSTHPAKGMLQALVQRLGHPAHL